MICNKCGTDVPEHSTFCIRCGNRLRGDTAGSTTPSNASGAAPAPSQPQQPKPSSSGSPFGTKTISDRHYTLEDIARQQAESNNEIGLASAPPRRSGKSKKRRHAPEAALPPIGSSDDINMDELNTTPAAQPEQPAQTPASANAVPLLKPEVPLTNPLLPSMEELKKAPPQQGKPVKHQTTIPQSTESANPLLQSLSDLTAEPKPKPSSAAAAPAPASQPTATPVTPVTPATPPSPQTAPQPTASVSAAGSAYTGQTYRYTIATPPVPSGLQRQTNIDLFGGTDVRPQVEALRRDYFARKNAASPQ